VQVVKLLVLNARDSKRLTSKFNDAAVQATWLLQLVVNVFKWLRATCQFSVLTFCLPQAKTLVLNLEPLSAAAFYRVCKEKPIFGYDYAVQLASYGNCSGTKIRQSSLCSVYSVIKALRIRGVHPASLSHDYDRGRQTLTQTE